MVLATAALLEAGMGLAPSQRLTWSADRHRRGVQPIVLALNTTHVELQRAHAERATLHSGPVRFPWRPQSIDDLVTCADTHPRPPRRRARPYRDRVRRVRLTGSRPTSSLAVHQRLADADRLLPAITLPGNRDMLADQNASITAARVTLFAIIEADLGAGSAIRYDEPASAEQHAKDFDRADDRVSRSAAALRINADVGTRRVHRPRSVVHKL